MKKPNWNKCSLFLMPYYDGRMVDYSPSINHAEQVVTANMPTISNNGLNIHKSLEYNGIVYPNCDYLEGNAINPYEKTFFGIAKVDDYVSATKRCIFTNRIDTDNKFAMTLVNDHTLRVVHDNGTSYVQVSGDFSLGVFHTFSVSMTAGRVLVLFIDGIQYSGVLTETVDGADGEYWIGINDKHVTADNCRAFKGDIQTVGAFDYCLSLDEHKYMNTYLRTMDFSKVGAV